MLYISPLKALAVDVERNLRAPLAGIANVAHARNVAMTLPEITIRTGDTPAQERARFLRESADILITTPESLFLLLTSNSRARLTTVDTVIIDEIHALVPTKRGAHLALSLERLEALRAAADQGRTRPPLQRIGLSATQRPLDEVARFLGGTQARAVPKVRRSRKAHPRGNSTHEEVEAEIHEEFGDDGKPPGFRPVTIINASERKPLKLRIDVPVEEMARVAPRPDSGHAAEVASGPASRGAPSIWTSIHPRLLELIRTHQSTLLFVNSRRLAQRLAGALNELAGEPLVRSHHGSLAREARSEVEELLKAGRIKALVATSSLELGIDMGAIDLVVQIEAPPSVASGLQRIGRAGHQAGAVSEGIIIPKFRGDLVACAAVARAMHDGQVESTRYPRNPLDVLAQQIVAMAGLDTWDVDDLFAAVRRAAPFVDLSRHIFEGVLDMLSGRYPSDEFAELRPRVTWDRVHGTLTGREGATRVAIANAGTIPDRGLYGVFLAGADRPVRVGELDEEMVFESQVGETFTLGASTWRIEEITHDRVLVSPAPGEPGKMPFWHGDRAGRPVELGYTIGRLVRELRSVPRPAAFDRLTRLHDLDAAAAENLLRYLDDQMAAGGVPGRPDDRHRTLSRRSRRLASLPPFPAREPHPRAVGDGGSGADSLAHGPGRRSDVGRRRVRRPLSGRGDATRSSTAPSRSRRRGRAGVAAAGIDVSLCGTLQGNGRACALLPRRRPGRRTPLWQQRKRASDLLAVASRFGSFPALLETYREILRDHFDMPALVETLRRLQARTIRLATFDSRAPSPFAASLLFSYVANYIYDGDAPLAERRAQALSVDQAQLRELLGDAELRELLDPDAIAQMERQLQHLDEKYLVKTRDGLHDLLIRIGDLSVSEMQARSSTDAAAEASALERARRVLTLPIAGEQRVVAVEDVARYRDALGVPVPPGVPEALLEPVRDPAGDLALRYARSHGPFTAGEFANRYGLGVAVAESVLRRLTTEERLIEGEFRPGGSEREWVDAGVLKSIRRRSLARLRQEVEPVEADALGRFAVAWHGIGSGRRGLETLLDAVEQLQGAAIPASVLETEVLPARVAEYQPAMLDTLMAAGEVSWAGVEPLGGRDGRIALYLTDHATRLRPPAADRQATGAELTGRAADVRAYLRDQGASFFAEIHQGTGGGFPQETVDALWDLVWTGAITNDTLHPLRAYVRVDTARETRRLRGRPQPFRSRRLMPRSAEGRWALMESRKASRTAVTEWSAAIAQQLLTRHGVVTREIVGSEGLPGGFSAVYDVLKAMEESGRIRRGYFVGGLGGAQFALPAAVDLLRSFRDVPETPLHVILAATDPANPYGAVLKWPFDKAQGKPVGADQGAGGATDSRGATRSVGARVILVDGLAAGYLRRGERELLLTASDAEPQRSRIVRDVARALLELASAREPGRQGLLIAEINGEPAIAHPSAHLFVREGFATTAMGLQARIVPSRTEPRGLSRAESDGTVIAGQLRGGMSMADTPRSTPNRAGETPESEHDAIRSSNDRDQAAEREGIETEHNRGYDEAVKGRESTEQEDFGDVDPDSAESENSRDDTIDEP